MVSPVFLLPLIVALPLFGALFVLTARDTGVVRGRNAFNVCIFTVISNVILLWRVFMVLNEKDRNLQLLQKFDWLSTPDINLVFGVDTFSLLLILALHLAILIGLVGVRANTERQMPLMVFALLFLSMSTGLFVAADIFSFYIFFEAMLLPLFMILGMFGGVKRQGMLQRFFLYNFIGALLLFVATMLIYYQFGSISLEEVRRTAFAGRSGVYIWTAVGLSFISRIPIWPFHYWISSINSAIRNPLAFIIMSFMPLTALYGFTRFLPDGFWDMGSFYIGIINIVGVITMLFIALIGFINRETQYKIFAYATVYNIMYLLGIFTGDDLIVYNIGYALFGFMIIISALEVLSAYIKQRELEADTSARGFLCRARRLSAVYSFMIIAAVGFPVSAVFVNNFLILARLLGTNVKIGALLVCTLVIAGMTLLQELFRLKADNNTCRLGKSDDISRSMFGFMLFVAFILLMSFVKPLWFVVG